MTDFRTALLKSGAVTPERHQLANAEAWCEEDLRKGKENREKKEREKRWGILNETTDPRLFRREARRILLDNPDTLPDVIRAAHDRGMNRKKEGGGTWLVANLLQLRKELYPERGHRPTREEKIALVEEKFRNK